MISLIYLSYSISVKPMFKMDLPNHKEIEARELSLLNAFPVFQLRLRDLGMFLKATKSSPR